MRDGLLTNIWMFLLSEVLVLIFGLGHRLDPHQPVARALPLSSARHGLHRRRCAGCRSCSPILLVGYGLPELDFPVISYQSPAVYGVVALMLGYSAYVAEVIRAGIFSVPNGQLMAARSLGLTQVATMRRVILPQAIRNVIPPLLNDFISLQKDTALVSVLGCHRGRARGGDLLGDRVQRERPGTSPLFSSSS